MYNFECNSRPAQVPVYEMVDLPAQGDSSSKADSLLHEQGDANTEQFILKQEQAKSFPHEYLTPTISKFNQRAGQGQAVAADEENTYQPLIPPRVAALGDEKSEYQLLTLKTNTLPTKFSVSPVGPAPPAIPPKPKAM